MEYKQGVKLFIKDKQKKNKQKETLERSQEIEKRNKVHENLKVLHAYIKKLRVNKHDESGGQPREASKSERQTKRKSTSSKHNRRTHNRSRLYENAQKLFDYPHPKNQSLDTKSSKNGSKHISYLSLCNKPKSKAKRSSDVSETNPEESSKGKSSASKYFSAPVSTKENGKVIKFKFKKSKEKSKNEFDELQDVSEDDERSNIDHSQDPRSLDDSRKQPKLVDHTLPKNDVIQKIFSGIGNSPEEKVVRVSVINSTENFEDIKNHKDEEEKGNNTAKQSDRSNSAKLSSSKAAVPILDFTNLPDSKKKSNRSSESIKNKLNLDNEIKSVSGGGTSIFDQESHLDLSSKRIKNLILTSDFSSLLNLREEALKYKEQKERSKIDKLLKTSKISPRTGQLKEYELEKWVSNEREEISKTKKIIDEARKKTEDVLKEAQTNADFMKQILSEKVTTPRDGVSIRSGMNSSRRHYERHKDEDQDLSPKSGDHETNEVQKPDQHDDKQDNKSEKLDALDSVDTPQIGSENNSSFNNTKKIKFDPALLTEELSSPSHTPSHHSPTPDPVPSQTLSRKKSEQHLKDIRSKPRTPSQDLPHAQPSAFNSDNFFTKNYDEQEMDEAIEQLKNTSGKANGSPDSTSPQLDKSDIVKAPLDDPKPQLVPDSNSSSKLTRKDLDDGMSKPKLSPDNGSKPVPCEESKCFGASDVDAHRKPTIASRETEDSRNDKRVVNDVIKSSNTNESYKEEFLLDSKSDQADSDNDDKAEDSKNITGETSLFDDTTPGKSVIGLAESEHESDDKSGDANNSDSKYATVSILSEMSKKDRKGSKNTDSDKDEEQKQEDVTKEKVDTLADFIYATMLEEVKAELFPQRSLFLLTTDLEKIDLDQAMDYLNKMTLEKEAELIGRYIGEASQNSLHPWDFDDDGKDSDDNMFSDNTKLVLYERKGIPTDLFSIERYVDELATEVDDQCKSKFLTDTFTAITKDSLAMLNQLQNSDIGSYEHFETDLNSVAILPLEIYLELEKRKTKDSSGDDIKPVSHKKTDNASKSSKERKEMDWLKECEHIHNKALFDSINESLLQFKPYGKDGEPMPWSRKQRKLQKTPIQKDIDIRKMFEIIKHDMFRWSIMQAGTLPRREFIFSGVFDEELFAEIREKKLATLLATEVIENEYKWLNYDFEEAQVRIDLGDMILEHLVTE